MSHRSSELKELTEVQDILSNIEISLKVVISKKSIIDPIIISNFSDMINKLTEISDIFFSEFSEKYMEQIATFGSIVTTIKICEDLRNNLYTAKERQENPIAAERLMNNNYLLYLGTIFEELNKVYKEGKMSQESFMLLSKYIGVLISLSKRDEIFTEQSIPYYNENIKRALLDMFSRLDDVKL